MALGIISGVIIGILALAALVWFSVELDSGNNGRALIAGLLLLVFVVSFVIVPFSFHTVDTGTVAVVKRLGKAKEVKTAGTHFGSWVTNKYVKYDTKVRGIYIEDMAYSSDAQQMTLKISFQYQIMGDKVLDITNTYGSLDILDARMQSIVIENAKAVLSKYTAMDIIANRSTLSPEIEEVVMDALDDAYFVTVVNVALINIDFSDAFETAVEEKMIAEQKQLKAKYEADAKIVTAEATAKANELLERSLTDKILQEMYINKWDGELPQVVTDGNMMFQLPNQ